MDCSSCQISCMPPSSHRSPCNLGRPLMNCILPILFLFMVLSPLLESQILKTPLPQTSVEGLLLDLLVETTPTDTVKVQPLRHSVFSLYFLGSPSRLAPLNVPQIYIQGNDDFLVPATYVKKYVKTATDLGDQILYYKSFNSTGHFELIVPTTEAGQGVIEAIKRLHS